MRFHRTARAFVGVTLLVFAVPAPATAQEVPDAAAVRDMLAPYMGTWRSELHETRDGRSFRFGYDLAWFDEGRTVAKMTIVQLFADGEAQLLWEGFKGKDAATGTVYYWAVSPGGRRAEGVVVLDGEDLVTTFTGYTPDGETNRLRDVFTPLDEHAFVNVTWIERDGEWQELMRDRWERHRETEARLEEFLPDPMQRLRYLLGRWSRPR